MSLRPSNNKDELCYPFIYEHSYLCDYEVATDELCNHIGLVLSLLPADNSDIQLDLQHLQPLVYHLNGSLRGKLAIETQDQQWLLDRYAYYREQIKGRVNGFVIPRGTQAAMHLHLARSAAKKAIRCMVRIDQEGKQIPEIVHRFCNVLCNFFFVLAIYTNQQQGIQETPFVSKSYGTNSDM